MKLRVMPRRIAAILCAAMVALLAGCAGASSPHTAAGVRAMYRSIGLDAGAGDFPDVCHSYMDEPLRNQVKKADNDCTTASYSSKLERWAEAIRLSKVTAATRIVLSADQARVYDGTQPETALYLNGQWRLADVPELVSATQTASVKH